MDKKFLPKSQILKPKKPSEKREEVVKKSIVTTTRTRRSNSASEFLEFPSYTALNTKYEEEAETLFNINTPSTNNNQMSSSFDKRKNIDNLMSPRKGLQTPRMQNKTDERKILTDVENEDLESLKQDVRNKKYSRYIDQIGETGETALLNAAFMGRVDMMLELIDAGADIKVISMKNQSNVLHYLCKHYKKKVGTLEHYSKLIYKLIYMKINIHAKDETGNSVFHVAAKVGNTKALKILLPHCQDINMENNYGDTPILYATMAKHQKVCQLMFEYGANIFLKSGMAQESAVDLVAKNFPNIDPKTYFWKTEFVSLSPILINEELFLPCNDQSIKIICGPTGQNSYKIAGVYSQYKTFFFSQTHFVFYFQDHVPSSSKIVCVMKNAKNGEHKSLLINVWGIFKISIDSKEVTKYSFLTDDFASQLKFFLNDNYTSKRIEVDILKPRIEYDQLVKLKNTCTTKTSVGSLALWNEINMRSGINLDLLGLEAKLGSVSIFSVGVAIGYKGQKDEEEMFLNEKMSDSFKNFLEILGDEVDSKKWEHFAGGLPYEHSTKFYYTGWRGFEIAFHVAPLLSEQERRQYIGNDKAIIYFVEDPLDANFRGNVNSIGLVVKEQDEGLYDMGIFLRNRVDKFHPYLPKRSFTKKEIRDVIFINLINGIESVSKSHPYSSTIDTLFENEIASLILKHKK